MFFFKFLIKYIHLLPDYISKNFLLNNNKFSKSEIIFDTIQYKSDYNSDNFLIIFLPLIINISQILSDIKKKTDNELNGSFKVPSRYFSIKNFYCIS